MGGDAAAACARKRAAGVGAVQAATHPAMTSIANKRMTIISLKSR